MKEDKEIVKDENYKNNLENSLVEDLVERVAKAIRMEKENILKKIIAILLTATLTLGVAPKMVSSMIDSYNDPARMGNLEEGIVALLDEDASSICSRNAFRIDDGRPNSFGYNQEGIATDILKILQKSNRENDTEFFDYILGTICYDFGSNIYNEVGVNGRSNIDSVIYYLKSYSSGKNSEKLKNDTISKYLKDIEGIDDYLTKKGYVDKLTGKPKLEKFMDACNKNAKNIIDLLDEITLKGGLK